MNRIQLILFSVCLALQAGAHAFHLPKGHANLTLGGARIHQGGEQLIRIQNTFGNIHRTQDDYSTAFLAGVGYLFDVSAQKSLDLSLGASVFYLSPAETDGIIDLERTFPDLSYRFKTTNVPIYASAKAVLNGSNRPVSIVANLGVGLNVIKTHDYEEHSLDAGVTLPNQSFRDNTDVKFSATAGFGLRFNQAYKSVSFELGYQYFYLNQGGLNPRPQVLTTLHTGQQNFHALALTLIV